MNNYFIEVIYNFRILLTILLFTLIAVLLIVTIAVLKSLHEAKIDTNDIKEFVKANKRGIKIFTIILFIVFALYILVPNCICLE